MAIYGLLESNEYDHAEYMARLIRFNDRGYGPFADPRKRVTRKEINQLRKVSRPSRYRSTSVHNHPDGILVECIPHGEVVSLDGDREARKKFARTEMLEKIWWCAPCASEAGLDLEQDTSEVNLKVGDSLLMPSVLGPKGGERVAGGIYELEVGHNSSYALYPRTFLTNARNTGETLGKWDKWVHDVRGTKFLIEGLWYNVHWISLSAHTSWSGQGPLLLELDPRYKPSKSQIQPPA